MTRIFLPSLFFFSSMVFAVDIPPLPEPMTNNAVAWLVKEDKGIWYLSALGLGPGKTWRDTLSSAYLFKYNYGEKEWKKLPDVPGPAGRLAAVAVGVHKQAEGKELIPAGSGDGMFYVFGGYTVAEDGSEKSIATVHSLDPEVGEWVEKAPMPVPVDDTVALLYENRYIYLVSGWHDFGNVNLVQVYDTHTDSWTQATPFPGSPVFGHAGGLSGMNKIVICDGVKIQVIQKSNLRYKWLESDDGAPVNVPDGPTREYLMSDECYRGEISETDYRQITWIRLPPHPGKPRYRMAFWDGFFIGGSENPYNYNGIGYNGDLSLPSDELFFFAHDWVVKDENENEENNNYSTVMPEPTMDHRGSVVYAGGFCVLGGMRAKQQVAADAQCKTFKHKVDD